MSSDALLTGFMGKQQVDFSWKLDNLASSVSTMNSAQQVSGGLMVL